MDSEVKHCNGAIPYSIDKNEEEDQYDDGESKSLAQTKSKPFRGGIAKKGEKRFSRVQWNDLIGKELVETLEYEPSESSDSEDEFSLKEGGSYMTIKRAICRFVHSCCSSEEDQRSSYS